MRFAYPGHGAMRPGAEREAVTRTRKPEWAKRTLPSGVHMQQDTGVPQRLSTIGCEPAVAWCDDAHRAAGACICEDDEARRRARRHSTARLP
jgi:hypothetical protein